MTKRKIYLDTSVLVDCAKYEHKIKLKRDYMDLAENNLRSFRRLYDKYQFVVPLVVIGEYAYVIQDKIKSEEDLKEKMIKWLWKFIQNNNAIIEPILDENLRTILETASEILRKEKENGEYRNKMLDATDSIILAQAIHDFDSKILLTTDSRMQEATSIPEIEKKIERPDNLNIIDDLSKI